jgi:ferrochelatase
MPAPTHAILLLAHGTPDTLGQMAEYLQHVTAGRPMPAHVVEELQHRYAEIGLRDTPLREGPPLTRWTLKQAELLANHIHQPVYVGMRNWHPFIAETVARMKADGIASATVLCLAPQNSRTSTGLYRRALDKALAEQGRPFTYTFISGWADEPLLAQAFAENLWPAWAEACARAPEGERVPVIFTAHSVPCRTLQSAASAPSENRPAADGIQDYGPATAGDPYPVECKRTAAAVARLLGPLGLREQDWFFAFQSQGIAGAPWIGPTVEETLKSLADIGHKAVVMQPIGFLCDHVEVLYDMDINFVATAATLGLRLTRAESLNASPTLTRALAHVVAQG